MKRSRILSVVAASAVVLGSAFFAAGTATAATTDTNATWVDSTSDLGAEGATYPTTGWFTGNVAPAAPGTTTFSPAGVTLTGTTQLLTATNQVGADLTTLVTSASFISTGSVDFQLPMYTNATGPNTGFTTLRPADFGDQDFVADGGGRWTTSGAFGTFAAGTTHTINEYQAELATTAPNATIIGYGFITPAGATGTVKAVDFADETTYFTPEPQGDYQPVSTTVTGIRTTGIHITGSGYFPGETVDVLFTIDGAQSSGDTDITYTADANGAIDEQFIAPAGTVSGPGSYFLTVVGEQSGIFLQYAITVTADPAVVAPVVPNAPVATPVRTAATFAG